jgi:hypothetical protein
MELAPVCELYIALRTYIYPVQVLYFQNTSFTHAERTPSMHQTRYILTMLSYERGWPSCVKFSLQCGEAVSNRCYIFDDAMPIFICHICANPSIPRLKLLIHDKNCLSIRGSPLI